MDSSRRLLFTVALTGMTAAAGVYLLWKYRKKNKTASRCAVKILCPRSVLVVTNDAEWEEAYTKLADDLLTSKVIGFDCEWISVDGKAEPVSLLQLATSSGLCVLVRLRIFPARLPASLHTLLDDRNILKVGVACLEDARKLENDFGICCYGCLDLRHLAMRILPRTHGGRGLKGLTMEVLGVDLDKNEHVRRGNWEADTLSPNQVHYAACDALAAVRIFETMLQSKDIPLTDLNSSSKTLASLLQGLIDVKFKIKSANIKNASNSSTVAPQTKAPGQAYAVRKKPLYYNCRLQSADGQLLCTCDIRKARWYLDKELGEKVSDDPLTVRLLFEPAGRPLSETNYYLQEKFNVCVVCGADDSYIKKNVIPREYRKHFPSVMKEHKSHDVILMCTRCHQLSNSRDGMLKQRLAKLCDTAPDSTKYTNETTLLKVKSAAKALLSNKQRLPVNRRDELEHVIKVYYGVQELDSSILDDAAAIDSKKKNIEYAEHGLKVFQYAMVHDGLPAFERLWRQHFIDTMKPAFLPALWSVDHCHDELISMEDGIKQTMSEHSEFSLLFI